MDRTFMDRYAELRALLHAGKAEMAIALCKATIQTRPDDAVAYQLLALALNSPAMGEGNPSAILSCAKAFALQPELARQAIATILQKQCDREEAILYYRAILQLNPQAAEIHCNLSALYVEKHHWQEALESADKATILAPSLPEAHYNQGIALGELERLPEAIAAFRKAIALKPGYVHALYNLATALQKQEEIPAAIAVFREVIALAPTMAKAHGNLATALVQQLQFDEAIAGYRQAIALQPDYADAHVNLAHTLLRLGNLSEGFREYEWRRQSWGAGPRAFVEPTWDGTPLEGRTILLWAEQGLGDGIQFARYVAIVAQMGGRVLLECVAPLTRLFFDIPGVDAVLPQGATLPPFDVQCSLMSLPRILETTLDTIPQAIPYLNSPRSVPSGLFAPAGFKIGIAWASGYREKRELFQMYRLKSCPLDLFLKLLEFPQVSLFSLQVGHDALSAKQNFLIPERLFDLAPSIRDFADTADWIAELDLVISVDTAIAHLAGAMGKPVWVLLPHLADWRWLCDREDSPWYPTMRLFRQRDRGNWEDVMARVTAALQILLSSPI